MYSKEVVVRCESGLHNKQATYFVQKANEYESSIWLESGNRKMNAKSLLGIMSLGIVSGSTVTLSAVPTKRLRWPHWKPCSSGTFIDCLQHLPPLFLKKRRRFFKELS